MGVISNFWENSLNDQGRQMFRDAARKGYEHMSAEGSRYGKAGGVIQRILNYVPHVLGVGASAAGLSAAYGLARAGNVGAAIPIAIEAGDLGYEAGKKIYSMAKEDIPKVKKALKRKREPEMEQRGASLESESKRSKGTVPPEQLARMVNGIRA